MEKDWFVCYVVEWYRLIRYRQITSHTRLMIKVCVIAILIFFGYSLYGENDYMTTFMDVKIQTIAHNENNTRENSRILKEEKSLKLVLFYTALFGRTPWPTIENDLQFTRWNNIPCEVQNCRISYDKSDLNKSDAVIFHGQDIGSTDLYRLSRTCPTRATQRWVFFIHENPLFFTHDLRSFDNVFNWTMSYKLSSDIFVPYFYYFPRHEYSAATAELKNGEENYALGKDKLVAWMVSHCGKQRDKIVKKLMEYLPVHVYGACTSKFSQKRTCSRRDKTSCRNILRRYKFYLAFENANCNDYITEKYWASSLQNNIVPIVLGGGNYSNINLAIPGSFINVMDFSSVKDLADHLVMLDKNDTAYNEYFSWRKLYYVGFPPSWTCKLCSMLNNATIPRKTYSRESFAKFWSRETNCGFLDEKIERIIASPNM